MSGPRRVGVVVALCVVLVAVAGCGGQGTRRDRSAPTPSATTAPRVNQAEGACQLLDFEVIRKNLGLVFTVAAAGKQGETYTCLVQAGGSDLPDLAISVTPTATDDKAFRSVMTPQGAVAVTGLGRVAYSVAVAPSSTAGPGVQVGWLAGNQRLLSLRLRLALTATPEEAAALGPKLVDLARDVDFLST